MLLRQNGRRRQHGNLLAAFDGEKRRAHGHFGLAVADIAANQSIHRLLALHAGEGFVDGALLVRGFFILESGLEFFVQVSGEREGSALRAPRAGRKAEPILRPSQKSICAPWL